MNTVAMPFCFAGTISLSIRSPTIIHSSALTPALLHICSKYLGSGFVILKSSWLNLFVKQDNKSSLISMLIISLPYCPARMTLYLCDNEIISVLIPDIIFNYAERMLLLTHQDLTHNPLLYNFRSLYLRPKSLIILFLFHTAFQLELH